GTVTNTSAHQAPEQRFARLFIGLYVIHHAWSSTQQPVVSTIELSRHLHLSPFRYSKSLCHPQQHASTMSGSSVKCENTFAMSCCRTNGKTMNRCTTRWCI
ncbi:hypothetical protein L210DRAFT_3522751, partial [Boletus edulis BED1]